MKLAEALQERADLNKKIAQLRIRLRDNALTQEGEKPAENPENLLNELNESIARLQFLISQINLTNCQTVSEGKSLTEMIAERDCLKMKLSAYQELTHQASQMGYRVRGSEIKVMTSFDVSAMQKEIDKMSKQYRLLDNAIQSLNWTTELK